MPEHIAREVRSTSPYALPFASCLPFSRLTGQLQVSVATWTAQLSTKANGHPLPVSSYARERSVRRNDQVPEGGWIVLVVRQRMAIWREKRGNGDGQSGTA